MIADLEEFLEPVVPANRISEVVKWLAFSTMESLCTIEDEVLLQLVILGEEKLACEPRFMYRYLQAAREFNRKHHLNSLHNIFFSACHGDSLQCTSSWSVWHSWFVHFLVV